MTWSRFLRTTTSACLAAAGLALGLPAILHSSAGAQSTPQAHPPDLVQVVPDRISVVAARVRGRRVWRLAFRSAVEAARGAGPIIIVGHRPSRATAFMTADQYVDVIDPASGDRVSQEVVRGVGRLRYVHSQDHEHWHYLGFERYELRRAADNRRVARDRKTGFCLGDRYLAGSLPTRAASVVTPVQLDQDCGSGEPRLLTVKEGITPGHGDDYKPRLEGQFLDITSAPSGRYLLVHRVNVDRKLRESDYANDVATALIELRRSGARKPTVRVLARCPGTSLCSTA